MEEEIFGPTVVLTTFVTEGEAIAKAVDSELGLWSPVYTRNISRAMRIAKAMEAGTVGINCTSPTLANDMLIWGYKRSGQGKEGFGYSLENYLEEKAILVKLEDLNGS
jgi:aldehyde dehydrogenase (NAD+)